MDGRKQDQEQLLPPLVRGVPDRQRPGQQRSGQDTIAALADLDIVCEFEQEEGARNHAGRYRIRGWGAIDRGWIERNLRQIKAVLEYP